MIKEQLHQEAISERTITIFLATDSSTDTCTEHLLAALSPHPAHPVEIRHTGIGFAVALLKQFVQDVDLLRHRSDHKIDCSAGT